MVTERICSVPPRIENPYRLVSLGDMMKQFGTQWFLDFCVRLGKMEEANKGAKPGDVLPDVFKPLTDWANYLDLLGLTSPSKAAKRMRVALMDAATPMPLTEWVEWAKDMQRRLIEASEDMTFLAVDYPDAIKYQGGEQLFGSEVVDAFPSTAQDIDEAGKCLALDRPTACVFHLTRVLQAGLYALASDLGVKATGRNWGLVIGDMEKEIARQKKAGPGTKASASVKASWKAEVEFHAAAAMHFSHLTDAFRNRTIHKTGYLFKQEKAQSIFDHARDFMQHLATKLSE
jgi:hypothetical protein